MNWLEHIIEVITDVMLVVLPADLLYIFFAKGWYEPNIVILHIELVVLFCLPAFAIWRLVRYIMKVCSK